MKHFFLKVSDCNEHTLDIVFGKLLDLGIEIKNFQVIGGGLMGGAHIGYIQCYGIGDLKEIKKYFAEYMPSFNESKLKEYEGTDKYERKKKEFMIPIDVDTIPQVNLFQSWALKK